MREVKEIIARLMAAIETPGDLTSDDIAALLEDADEIYQRLTDD